MKGSVFAAMAARVAAQVLTAWALLITFVAGDPDVLTVGFAVAALLASSRHNGSNRDRATACFSASLCLASVIGLGLVSGLLGQGLATETLLLLTATVLFSVAGGMHWVRRHDAGNGGAAGGAGA